MLMFLRQKDGSIRRDAPFHFIAAPPVVVATGSFAPPHEAEAEEERKTEEKTSTEKQ